MLCKPSERYLRINNTGNANVNDKTTNFDTRSGVRTEDKQLILINLIQNNPFITSAKMSELSGIPLRTVQRIISKLSEYGIIEHIGPTKKGQWVINENILSEWRKKWFE